MPWFTRIAITSKMLYANNSTSQHYIVYCILFSCLCAKFKYLPDIFSRFIQIERDTTVLNLVVCTKAVGGQIPLSVVSVL